MSHLREQAARFRYFAHVRLEVLIIAGCMGSRECGEGQHLHELNHNAAGACPHVVSLACGIEKVLER